MYVGYVEARVYTLYQLGSFSSVQSLSLGIMGTEVEEKVSVGFYS